MSRVHLYHYLSYSPETCFSLSLKLFTMVRLLSSELPGPFPSLGLGLRMWGRAKLFIFVWVQEIPSLTLRLVQQGPYPLSHLPRIPSSSYSF